MCAGLESSAFGVSAVLLAVSMMFGKTIVLGSDNLSAGVTLPRWFCAIGWVPLSK